MKGKKKMNVLFSKTIGPCEFEICYPVGLTVVIEFCSLMKFNRTPTRTHNGLLKITSHFLSNIIITSMCSQQGKIMPTQRHASFMCSSRWVCNCYSAFFLFNGVNLTLWFGVVNFDRLRLWHSTFFQHCSLTVLWSFLWLLLFLLPLIFG